MTHDDVLAFWFEEINPKQWWVKDEAFDEDIRRRFLNVHQQAHQCELFSWRATAQGRLAEVIVLDQFSRNMYRDTAQAFASDTLALALAQEAVLQGDDQALSPSQRSFLYMPYMHSESLVVHEEAERLFAALGNENTLEFERRHKAIIEKYGRYPHRNYILGRESSEQEIAFLEQPGSSF
ncbi:DUF924 domain-containing protein [Reinekea forsetii]|nr:DUF924 domain-containing protein [Reinekea forsetii]